MVKVNSSRVHILIKNKLKDNMKNNGKYLEICWKDLENPRNFVSLEMWEL